MPEILTPSMVQKELKRSIEEMSPNFYTLPYADPDADPKKNPSITIHPALNPKLDPVKYRCDCTLAFFTPNEDPGTFGNTLSDKFMTHVRDTSAVEQLAADLHAAGLQVSAAVIDSPNIKYPQVIIPNYVKNTEGEFALNGKFYSNDLLKKYGVDGIMWDAETDSTDYQGFAKLMKACFLAGIKRAPNHYRFTYTTYANRAIDKAILNGVIDPNGDEVDQKLHQLGFENFSDLITKRGNLSCLETMSYGGTAQELFDEGDVYALTYLAKGDPKKLYEMRKFISIGVAPGLTDPGVAKTVAAGCDPTKAQGFGRFMVWNGNCEAGLDLFTSMVDARTEPLPQQLNLSQEVAAARPKKLPPITENSGNRKHFLSHFLRKVAQALHITQPRADTATKKELPKEPTEESYCDPCCGIFTNYVNKCLGFFKGEQKQPDSDRQALLKL